MAARLHLLLQCRRKLLEATPLHPKTKKNSVIFITKIDNVLYFTCQFYQLGKTFPYGAEIYATIECGEGLFMSIIKIKQISQQL